MRGPSSAQLRPPGVNQTTAGVQDATWYIIPVPGCQAAARSPNIRPLAEKTGHRKELKHLGCGFFC